MSKRIKIVCNRCGSDDVRRDAWAEWDVASQAWVLGTVFDAGYCEGECEGEASLKEVEIKEEKDDDKHFIQVEYDKTFFGGDYSGVGDYALIHVSLVKPYGGVPAAFKAETGIDTVHIIHYSEDQLYDKNGNEVEV